MLYVYYISIKNIRAYLGNLEMSQIYLKKIFLNTKLISTGHWYKNKGGETLIHGNKIYNIPKDKQNQNNLYF